MATNKTPPHKRIKRAEEGRDDWKLKATERREEIVKLSKELSSKDEQLSELAQQNKEHDEKLNAANKKISELEKQIENLKKKVFVEDDSKPFHHRFPTYLINKALELYRKASLGYRTIANVLNVIFNKYNLRTPHYTTIRTWVIRNGCYLLQQPIAKGDDWIVIGDLTIDVGKIKCLALLGVQMNKLESREDYTLSHEDVVLLDLYPTEKATADFIHSSIQQTREKCKTNFLAFVTDQGSEIKKGCQLFIQNNTNTQLIHDIPHKLSLVMEKELKDDPIWKSFTAKLLETSRLVLQTEFAALKPGNQRSKARFMDIGYLVKWPKQILELRDKGLLNSISKDRYQKYFGWIPEYEKSIDDFVFQVGVVDVIKDILRKFGLSRETYEYLQMYFEISDATDNDRVKTFVTKALNTVKEEFNKLSDDQTLICSTEVLESIFGKFKAIINNGHQGITSNILGIATFVGPERTMSEVKQAMEGCSVKSAMEWVKMKVGTTLGSIRYRYFRGNKGTKFDNSFKPTFNT